MWILSPLVLFKLLVKASIPAKHEIISKCKAGKHWLCRSQVSGWCFTPMVSFPLRSALPAQSCPQAFICWRHVEKVTKSKFVVTQLLKKVCLEIFIRLGHQRGRKSLMKLVELGVFEVDFLVQDPALQQLNSQIWLSHSPALSEHPSFTTASRSLLCSLPRFVLTAFHASQQCKSWTPSWAAHAPHWACVTWGAAVQETVPLTLVCSSKPGEPSHTAELALLHGRAPSASTWRP